MIHIQVYKHKIGVFYYAKMNLGKKHKIEMVAMSGRFLPTQILDRPSPNGF